jgi:hypothetical protein
VLPLGHSATRRQSGLQLRYLASRTQMRSTRGVPRPALWLEAWGDPPIAIATQIRCLVEQGHNAAIIYGGTKRLPLVGGPETTV